MSCSQLDSEIAIASNYKRDAKSEKSYGTATNVGAILFWLPGVVATQMNANDAIRAADERINHLTRLNAKKTVISSTLVFLFLKVFPISIFK